MSVEPPTVIMQDGQPADLKKDLEVENGEGGPSESAAAQGPSLMEVDLQPEPPSDYVSGTHK